MLSFAFLRTDLDIKHQSLNWELKDSLIEKLMFNLANPSSGIAIGDATIAFTLTQNTKQLHKIQLPNEPPKKVCAHFLFCFTRWLVYEFCDL